MNKYYIIRDVNFAKTIKWLSGEKYMIFDDVKNEGCKIYSFENNERFKRALTIANEAKSKMG